jgi:hypothetical protein
MMRIPLPKDTAQRISDKAVQNARQSMAGLGWKTHAGLVPFAAEGQVGIKTSVKYLMFQEKGIKPFLMKWVEGRTIGMACKVGDGPHFRKGSHVGTPGFVDIPHKGRVWRQSRWRHPGLKPKNFMRNAIEKAIKDEKHNIHQDIMSALKGEFH